MSDPVIIARARLGGRISLGSSPELVIEARQELTAAKLERHIREVIAAAPPITDSQREKLAMLLLRGE